MTTDRPRTAEVRRRRLQLIVIASLFFGPLALAFVAYYGGVLLPSQHANHGELVAPPTTLPEAGVVGTSGLLDEPVFHGKWTILQVSGPRCDARCVAALADSRQVRELLGHDLDRVRRVLLVDGPCCAPAVADSRDPGLVTVWLAGSDWPRLKAALPGYVAGTPGYRYLVDPHGNLMMRYAADAPDKGMLLDLQRLLRLSHIG
jgi:hypothetical protein